MTTTEGLILRATDLLIAALQEPDTAIAAPDGLGERSPGALLEEIEDISTQIERYLEDSDIADMRAQALRNLHILLNLAEADIIGDLTPFTD